MFNIIACIYIISGLTWIAFGIGNIIIIGLNRDNKLIDNIIFISRTIAIVSGYIIMLMILWYLIFDVIKWMLIIRWIVSIMYTFG